MSRLVSAILVVLVLLATARADAGAWPREEGQVFVSLGQTMSTGARSVLDAVEDVRSYTALYAEYGLTPELTFGLDTGLARGDQDPASAWTLFLRRPVWVGESGHRFAAELGLGQLNDPQRGRQWRIKPGLSWGRGFESRFGGGWAGLESSAAYRFASEDFEFKTDLTVGIRPSDRWMLIFQVQSGRFGSDDPIVRLAPSVVRRFGEKTHLQLSFIQPITGDDALGVKLATWLTF
jgi:hypothetical protein